MSDRIEKIVELAAPVSRVWRALTDHQEFGQWFRVRIDAPFVVGQVSRGMMLYPGFEHVPWEALIQRMEPERHFSFLWPADPIEDGKDFSNAPTTLVEFDLEPTDLGTRLTIVESGISKLPDHRRHEVLRSNTHGWNEQAGNIAAHVER